MKVLMLLMSRFAAGMVLFFPEADELAGGVGALERDRVLAGEAGGAVADALAAGVARGLDRVEQAVDREVAEAVAGHVAGDLGRRVRRRDELRARRRVDAVVAGVR